jgi:hypothetical protein
VLARRIGLGVAAWVVAVTGFVVFIARPEQCPDFDDASVSAAAAAAVGWFDANQHDDGSWLYRYDKATQTDLGGYNLTRHAGVLLSLYQASDLTGGDAGLVYALDRLHRERDWAAFGEGEFFESGASALLVAALGERRLDTDDAQYDDVLGELGRFLVAMTDADGKVFAFWEPSTQTASGTSIFSTGETWFALNRLERLFPDAGWREPAERVGRYVMQHRDDAEDVFPPTSDHWGAYAIDEMQHWATPPSAELSQMTDAYAERLAGIFGVQVRFESQRTDSGVNVLLRGHQALPSGLGTLGEGLGALARYEDARGRPHDAEAVADRMSCAVGMLVDRQVTSDDVRADGAWFHSDVTQMDDQQHPLSTLIAYG